MGFWKVTAHLVFLAGDHILLEKRLILHILLGRIWSLFAF